jgi:hypothetical protein
MPSLTKGLVVVLCAVAIGLLLRAWLRRRRPLPGVVNQMTNVRVGKGRVFVKHANTPGSISVRTSADGLTVETDKGGTVEVVVDGREIVAKLAPGEKRFFGPQK